MKALTYLFLLAGIGLLAVAIIGRFMGNHQLILGSQPKSIAIFANSMFLLAISSKLLQKP